jgi:hypothetical protein
MWIFSFLLDHIPLWLSLTICGAIAIVALYFASPILIPLWRALPTPVRRALEIILALIIAVLAGRYKGAKDERDAAAKRDAQALQNRTEVDHEVSNLSAKDTKDQLSRWNRD